jgi:hypothetical protein
MLGDHGKWWWVCGEGGVTQLQLIVALMQCGRGRPLIFQEKPQVLIFLPSWKAVSPSSLSSYPLEPLLSRNSFIDTLLSTKYLLCLLLIKVKLHVQES